MKSRAIIEAFNRMLAQDEMSARRNPGHAAGVVSPGVQEVAARLKDICADELVHAGRLRQRIVALGGIPTTEQGMGRD